MTCYNTSGDCKEPIRYASLVVTIPHPLMQVLELSKGDNIILELARDKNEKVIVLRKLQKEELTN
jgi:antitoxin component of MazEF toxin-antitoxin module